MILNVSNKCFNSFALHHDTQETPLTMANKASSQTTLRLVDNLSTVLVDFTRILGLLK